MNNKIYDIKLTTIEGKQSKMSEFKGKVLLIVNVASKCGFTPQYKGLQKLYEKYRDRGFTILAFPANNFLWQEPGSNSEIKKFCTMKYGVTFPVFEKTSVSGKNQHPLYKYLTKRDTNPELHGRITWNFNKFLVDRSGNIIARFGSKTSPESPEIIDAIKKLVNDLD